MAEARASNAEPLEFCCITTRTDCSHVGTPGYLRVIALKRGDALPRLGEVLWRTPCSILAPDQSCDYCGYEEKHYVTDVIRLDGKAIASMGLHWRVDDVLQDRLALPLWDWNSGADWQRFVADFTEVDRELLHYFASHPEKLQNLHWRHFEELIAAILKDLGYRTVLGTGSHDQGVDLRLIQKDAIGELVTLVQVKRYAAHNAVGLETVQALSAAVDAERATRGLLVTSSRFLPGAKAFADKLGTRLVLCGPDEVARWCELLCNTGGRL